MSDFVYMVNNKPFGKLEDAKAYVEYAVWFHATSYHRETWGYEWDEFESKDSDVGRVWQLGLHNDLRITISPLTYKFRGHHLDPLIQDIYAKYRDEWFSDASVNPRKLQGLSEGGELQHRKQLGLNEYRIHRALIKWLLVTGAIKEPVTE